MPANAHTSKKFTHMCFEQSEVTSAEINFQVGCQDRLRVNSDADEALA